MGKKLVGLLSAAGLLVGLTVVSQAALSDMFKITVKINRTASVDVSTDSNKANLPHQAGGSIIAMGDVKTSQQIVLGEPIYVFNTSPADDGAAVQSYGIHVSGIVADNDQNGNAGTPWRQLDHASFAATEGVDDFYLLGVFRNAKPAWSDFAADDLVNTSTQGAPLWTGAWANSTTPSRWNPATGAYAEDWVALPGKHFPDSMPGAHPIQLWLGMATPLAVDFGGAAQQAVTVVVTTY